MKLAVIGKIIEINPIKDADRIMPMAGLVLAGNHAMDSDGLRVLAEVKYPTGKHGEGIVVRCLESGWSFKVINLNYRH